MTLFLLLGLIGFLLLNIPIAFALLFTSVIYIFVKGDMPMIVVAQRVVAGTDHYLLLAIPFFFLAAEIMNAGGIMARLVRVSTVLVGHIRGGLAHMSVVSNMLLAGVSGSAVADAAGLGRLQVEMMRQGGYGAAFSAAISGSAATVGPIIPPSIPFVVYGSIAGVSIGSLFLAGVVPGALMGLFLMGASYWISRRRGYPLRERAKIGEVVVEFLRAIPVLLLPLIILGGILSGVFTPTEAAAVASFYAFALGMFVLRGLSWLELWNVIVRVGRDTARLMFIVACGSLYAWILAREGIPQAVAASFLEVSRQPWIILLMINLLLLVLGCFLEPIVILILVVPILAPLVADIGVDLVHFGVIVTLNLMIGLLTPPVGTIMFIMMSIANLRMEEFVREVLPFLIALIVVLGLVTYVPAVVLTLPQWYLG
ncbi:MAG: TRAP transporter large permease [Pseudorhodoplanes sp.]|nr:TRAP transporter large permease [Pseudorhodoplanes sp.]